MNGIRRVQKERDRAGTGHGRGDFSGDLSRLSDPAQNDLASAVLQKFDGGDAGFVISGEKGG